MTSYGTVTDYTTGEPVRTATATEWRHTADVVNDNYSAGNYSGAWQDTDGRTVYVDGGPDAEISEHDVEQLRSEAGSAGDAVQVRLCDAALKDDGSQESIEAFRVCVRVILDARMNGAV